MVGTVCALFYLKSTIKGLKGCNVTKRTTVYVMNTVTIYLSIVAKIGYIVGTAGFSQIITKTPFSEFLELTNNAGLTLASSPILALMHLRPKCSLVQNNHFSKYPSNM